MPTILILEDEPIVAQVLEITFENNGFDVLDVVSDVTSALDALARICPDIAILDINLGEETSFAAADQLVEMGVRFCFFTAYEDSAIPERFKQVTIIPKTEPRKNIIETLRGLLQG